MKKLLSLLGTITLVGSTSASVIACTNDNNSFKEIDKEQLKKCFLTLFTNFNKESGNFLYIIQKENDINKLEEGLKKWIENMKNEIVKFFKELNIKTEEENYINKLEEGFNSLYTEFFNELNKYNSGSKQKIINEINNSIDTIDKILANLDYFINEFLKLTIN
ncbi:lipoprotein [Spiroplasma endosymbiont of Megaselia nigra]|uniref:lipoprotein n=1 Tax=Spiroplasma endosymbiont of Megaselia nigra TaxID=2478537 RepID=UPI000F861EE6|nr:lipoprotein [Spiroplasma endosymbiont of Megaselia nigra]RUO85985.1 hypothetical protein D9R21_05695 [Spiroplasma endosymbiont of Megaselia nigra]